MDIAKVKLSQLAQHGDLLDRYGAKVRVLGRREMLKPDVLAAVDRAVELTSRNGDRILNICFPYTSRDEITSAIRDTVIDYSKPIDPVRSAQSPRTPFSETHIALNIRAQALNSKTQEQNSDSESASTTSSQEDSRRDLSRDTIYESASSFSSSTTLHLVSGQQDSNTPKGSDTEGSMFISPEKITPQTLTDHMFTKDDPPLDLLIRTSGVERLSDFMLWQCHQNTEIVFLEVLWPEFDLWHFLPVLWAWQRRITKLRKGKAEVEEGLETDLTEISDDDVVPTAATRISKVKGL